MTGAKPPFASLTINAALVGLGVQILSLFGVEIAPAQAEEIGVHINSLLAAIAFVVAIYGRVRAKRQIGGG